MSLKVPVCNTVTPLVLTDSGVQLLDQTRLPHTVAYVLVETPEAMVEAIQQMVVRGAPAIGIAGAYGVVLAAKKALMLASDSPEAKAAFVSAMASDMALLAASRPTAVNLMWAVKRMEMLLNVQLKEDLPLQAVVAALTQEALKIHQEDVAANKTIGTLGAALLPKGATILTHCNAGALATGGYGTALGVVRAAFEADPAVRVFATETRPRMQGAKLTVWELMQEKIPVTLVPDTAVGWLMQSQQIDAVVVGADRIAANGDTANKIGTYHLAVLAKTHGIPFYVAAPVSTLDGSLDTGADIPIEIREAEEVTHIQADQAFIPVAPMGCAVWNPAFDVTPAGYITGIITERGVSAPPYSFFKE